MNYKAKTSKRLMVKLHNKHKIYNIKILVLIITQTKYNRQLALTLIVSYQHYKNENNKYNVNCDTILQHYSSDGALAPLSFLLSGS